LCLSLFSVSSRPSQLTSSSSVPFFLWTGRSYFSTSHAEYEQPFLLDDIQYSLLETKDLESHESAEVLVAFVADKLGSSEVAQLGAAFGAGGSDKLQNLKNVLSGARNSLIIDNVYSSYNTISQGLIQTRSISSPRGSNIKANLATETCDSVLNKLETSKIIFSNQVSDLVLITFSNYVDQHVDQCIERVTRYVETQANQKYISLLSADQSRVNPQLIFQTEKINQKKMILWSCTVFFKHLPLSMLQDNYLQ